MRNSECRVSNEINELGQWPVLRVVRAIVLSADSRQVLTVYRNLKGRHFPGQGEDPGGKIDPGNSPRFQLLLEIFQELNLTPLQYELLDEEPLINFMMFDPQHPDSLNTPFAKKLIYTKTFIIRLKPNAVVQLSDEHFDAKWSSLCEQKTASLTPYSRDNREKYIAANGRVSFSAQKGRENSFLR